MKYEKPKIEIWMFDTEEIVCASPGNGLIVEGSGSGEEIENDW